MSAGLAMKADEVNFISIVFDQLINGVGDKAVLILVNLLKAFSHAF